MEAFHFFSGTFGSLGCFPSPFPFGVSCICGFFYRFPIWISTLVSFSSFLLELFLHIVYIIFSACAVSCYWQNLHNKYWTSRYLQVSPDLPTRLEQLQCGPTQIFTLWNPLFCFLRTKRKSPETRETSGQSARPSFRRYPSRPDLFPHLCDRL